MTMRRQIIITLLTCLEDVVENANWKHYSPFGQKTSPVVTEPKTKNWKVKYAESNAYIQQLIEKVERFCFNALIFVG
jgi:hypothetical protein